MGKMCTMGLKGYGFEQWNQLLETYYRLQFTLRGAALPRTLRYVGCFVHRDAILIVMSFSSVSCVVFLYFSSQIFVMFYLQVLHYFIIFIWPFVQYFFLFNIEPSYCTDFYSSYTFDFIFFGFTNQLKKILKPLLYRFLQLWKI